MNTGFGFSEILLIATLIVIFFGSKELPSLLREIAKFTAKVRRYSDRIKRELDDVTRSLDPQPVPFAEHQLSWPQSSSGAGAESVPCATMPITNPNRMYSATSASVQA